MTDRTIRKKSGSTRKVRNTNLEIHSTICFNMLQPEILNALLAAAVPRVRPHRKLARWSLPKDLREQLSERGEIHAWGGRPHALLPQPGATLACLRSHILIFFWSGTLRGSVIDLASGILFFCHGGNSYTQFAPYV